MSTTKEKLKELRRELNMRKRVYPVWVMQGKMKQDVSDKQMKILEEIIVDYEEKEKQEDKQGVLL